jgi:hypothetical protein
LWPPALPLDQRDLFAGGGGGHHGDEGQAQQPREMRL